MMRKQITTGENSPTASFANRRLVKSLITATILSMAATFSLSTQANNPAPTIKVDAPNRYEVKSGDTLWDISGRYLDSPWRWRDIWAANKHVKNPHLIYPGDILLLCVIQGETLVGIDTGEGCAGIERAMQEPPVSATYPSSAPSQNITITPLDNSIPPIPLSAIQHWLDRVLIVNPADFESTPYVLASKNRNLLTAQGDTLYAKGVPLIVGQRYGVYREGEPYVDPTTKEIIGLEVKQVAVGVATDVASNGVTSIRLLETYESEVREGDRVFVELGNNLFAPVFYPRGAEVSRGGQIVRVMDSINSAAKGSIVAINLGRENGAQEGHVLTVFRRGPLVRDVMDNDMPVRLPSEAAGHLMIFKTFDKLSYAYVLDSELPLNVGDKLLPPSNL